MPRPSWFVLGPLAWVALACSGSPPTDGGVDSGSDAGLQGGRTVTVTLFDTHHTAAGPVAVPREVTARPLRAYVPRAGGGFDTFEGRWTDAGVGEIHHVPDASYYLQHGDFTYVVTDESALDLGQDTLGRAEVPVATVAGGTTLRLQGTFIAPWVDGDDLQLHSVSAGYLLFDVEDNGVQYADGGASRPHLNDTALDMTLDWARMRGPLLDAAQGDGLFVTKAKRSYLPSPLDGGNPLLMRTVTEVMTVPMQSVAEGGAAVASVPFTAVPSTTSVTLDWRRGAFATLRALANPEAIPYTDNFYIDVLPYTADAGFYTSSPDLVVIEADPAQAETIATSVSYGNPFPAEWPVFGQAVQTFLVRYRPNSGSARAIRTGVYVADLIAPLTAAPQRPMLVPAAAMKIDGFNATVAGTMTSSTPVVSWNAPVVGTPSHYTLIVHEFAVNGSTTNVEPVCFMWTTGTSVRIPPGVLSSSRHYVFEVIGYTKSRGDLAQHPYRTAFPEYGAGTLSALQALP